MGAGTDEAESQLISEQSTRTRPSSMLAEHCSPSLISSASNCQFQLHQPQPPSSTNYDPQRLRTDQHKTHPSVGVFIPVLQQQHFMPPLSVDQRQQRLGMNVIYRQQQQQQQQQPKPLGLQTMAMNSSNRLMVSELFEAGICLEQN